MLNVIVVMGTKLSDALPAKQLFALCAVVMAAAALFVAFIAGRSASAAEGKTVKRE